MARSLIHHLSTRERKHASVGVGLGGLVALDVIDRENEATATTAGSHRKLSLRNSLQSLGGRKPLSLNVPPSRIVHEGCLTPSAIVPNDSSHSSPSSACKSGVSSRWSAVSPSTIATPQSPLNKPLPPRPGRPSSPDPPCLPELPGSTPESTLLSLRSERRDEVMGLLVPEPVRMAQMEGFEIKRAQTTGVLGLPETCTHRRNRSENAAISKDGRDISPTPVPFFTQSRTPSLSREQSHLHQPGQPISPAHSSKKRTASGAPVQSIFPMTPDDVGRHRAVSTDAVQMERDSLARSLTETQGQIAAALSQLSRSQANERMLKAQLSGLEGRLEDANSQRVDALEQNLFLEERLQHLLMDQRSGALAPTDQATIVQSRPTSRLIEAEQKVQLLEEQLAAAQKQDTLAPIVRDLTIRTEQYQRAMLENARYIQALEQQNNDFRMHLENVGQRLRAATKTNEAMRAAENANKGLVQVQTAAAARLIELERRTGEQETQLFKLQAEKAQVDGLLQAEVRRQAIVTNKLGHPNAFQLSGIGDTEQTIADVKAKVNVKVARSASLDVESDKETPEQQIQRLQQEIDYHVQDIVLYKLDVKGYKKDLKRANAKLKKLTEGGASRQTLSPTLAGPAASPSLSCVSAATSSAPNSAHPTSPSPGPQNALVTGMFPQPVETLPVPPPPKAALPLPPTSSSKPRPKRVITPPAASFQKFASSTPTTPIVPVVPHAHSPSRQRSMTGPARSFTAPTHPSEPAIAPPLPHHRTHSDVSIAPHPAEADSRPIFARAEAFDSAETLKQEALVAPPKGHAVEQMSPPQTIKTHKERYSSDGGRNSLQIYGDVPNGGLPPIQMWGQKKVVV